MYAGLLSVINPRWKLTLCVVSCTQIHQTKNHAGYQEHHCASNVEDWISNNQLQARCEIM